MTRSVSLSTVASLCVATVAFPCGGSESYNVNGPLVSNTSFAEAALSPISDFEYQPRNEIRFLPGLLLAAPKAMSPLLGRAAVQVSWHTPNKAAVAEPSADVMKAAWARGDVDGAAKEARSVVDRVMSLPAAEDSSRNAALRLAAETIDLAPVVAREPLASRNAAFLRLARVTRAMSFDSMAASLARDNNGPRRASLAYAALRVQMRDGIPNASREDIGKQVSSSRWDSLHAAHRAWLDAYPAHPYAGLVKFSILRLFFLASDADSAWHTAIRLYAEYPARAAAEMRYLLLTGMLPPTAILTDASVPTEIRASLVGNLRPSREQWVSLMQMASAQRSAAWSANLEERLLATIATDSNAASPLPRGFPPWRATATPLWRYLWAVNMLRAGRTDDAVLFTAMPITLRQDSSLAPQGAMLAARILILRGEWAKAVQVPLLDEWTRRYMLRVLAPDSVAAMLASVSDHRAVARDARLVLATHAAQRGEWEGAAAQVRPVDASRAARYTHMAALVRDTSSNAGLQRFAQALAVSNGQLFYESTRYFYRGMVYRDSELSPERANDVWDLPWTRADERRRMYAYLRSGSERYLALRAYASYFARPGVSATQRRAAVRDADRVYRELLATDPSRIGEGFWADSLPKSAEARALRRAGNN